MRNLNDLQKSIGNTPLVEIEFKYKGKNLKIFSKLEYYNLSGSVKDRMAFGIAKKGIEEGKLKENYEIVEATSGNTGIAFCAIGAYLKCPVTIYMPDWMSEERRKLMRSFGAKIVDVSREEGGFVGSIEKAENYAKNNEHVFYPSQFDNPENIEAQYRGIGKELIEQLAKLNLVADGFVAGVGTGGVVSGTGKALKEKNPNTKIYPLEPLESPTLMTGKQVGKHRIAGISDEFIPKNCDLSKLDDIISVSDGDAILAAQLLAKNGLAVGISSGANFIGAIMALEKLGFEKTVATVFSDDNKKYLSTDLAKEEPVKDTYYTPNIEIINITCHGRCEE